ncbi:MAG: AAA family ATPase [Methylococcales bacterium]|nr:AAA family ATPase [Methylococcales bacterium]
MYLKKLQVKNFKSFQDISIEFNKEVNILTGVNNAGKTTMLEALALWHECFSKLIQEARRGRNTYKQGDYVLGNTANKYFPYDQINSVRAPNFEDIFYQCDKKNNIELLAIFENMEKELLVINFQIGQSGLNYIIQLDGHTTYDYRKFNDFFKFLPNPIGFYYASPVSAIEPKEKFATKPQIQDAILNRQSAKVFRNRLFNLYKNSSYFSNFTSDLSYILFDHQHEITISSPSDPNQDIYIVFNFKIGARDTAKEISLLGSGSLQIMEILLNLHYPDDARKDVNFVLLDEPDSHIHRDIQQRLLKTLIKFTQNTQIFLSTHNEALIRSASVEHLFHLDAKSINSYHCLGNQEIEKQRPKFSGIYPSITNPIISSLGHSNGLDFVNAIEADYLIFVEGEDDARVIDILLKKGSIGNRKRYVYWVLGGVSHIFEKISHYETVFSAIKNEKTLWKKSVLIFDRDYLDDKFLDKLVERLNVKLKTHVLSSYTFESSLFSNLETTALLLTKWLKSKGINSDLEEVETKLTEQYQLMKTNLEDGYNHDFYTDRVHEHDAIKEKVNIIFGKPIIKIDGQQFNTNIRKHIENCLDSGEFYKLMGKPEVTTVINTVTGIYGVSFNVGDDFVSLIECVDKSTWLDEWDFLTTL